MFGAVPPSIEPRFKSGRPDGAKSLGVKRATAARIADGSAARAIVGNIAGAPASRWTATSDEFIGGARRLPRWPTRAPPGRPWTADATLCAATWVAWGSCSPIARRTPAPVERAAARRRASSQARRPSVCYTSAPPRRRWPLDLLEVAARALEPSLDEAVSSAARAFAVDPGASPPRRRMTSRWLLEVTTRGALHAFEERLRWPGFEEDQADGVICRWRERPVHAAAANAPKRHPPHEQAQARVRRATARGRLTAPSPGAMGAVRPLVTD